MPGVGYEGAKYTQRCSTPVQGVGLATVIVNGKTIARVGDKTLPFEEIVPCKECCRTHTATVLNGSTTVFAGGKPVAWIGSAAQGITGNPTMIEGSPTVIVGS